MSADVTDIWARRPHGVYRESCNACGYECIAVVPEGADLTTLECGRCGACDSRAVLWDGGPTDGWSGTPRGKGRS
jgi:ferredoxin